MPVGKEFGILSGKTKHFGSGRASLTQERTMIGDLKVGNEVQFISAENGYGVTSLVEKLTPGEFLLLRHQADTQEGGKRERAQEWTGGKESYSLAEKDGTTTVIAAFDVPPEMEEYFKVNYPKALERVKVLAEGKK